MFLIKKKKNNLKFAECAESYPHTLQNRGRSSIHDIMWVKQRQPDSPFLSILVKEERLSAQIYI